MDVFTLYAGQGSLAAVRAGDEAIIIDAHMPECEDVTQDQIEQSLDAGVLTQFSARRDRIDQCDRQRSATRSAELCRHLEHSPAAE